jgi:hypothetical protein
MAKQVMNADFHAKPLRKRPLAETATATQCSINIPKTKLSATLNMPEKTKKE